MSEKEKVYIFDTTMRDKSKKHNIEIVGKKLRDMMPWIRKNKLVDTNKN